MQRGLPSSLPDCSGVGVRYVMATVLLVWTWHTKAWAHCAKHACGLACVLHGETRPEEQESTMISSRMRRRQGGREKEPENIKQNTFCSQNITSVPVLWASWKLGYTHPHVHVTHIMTIHVYMHGTDTCIYTLTHTCICTQTHIHTHTATYTHRWRKNSDQVSTWWMRADISFE